MNKGETLSITPVDAVHLEIAYASCAYVFAQRDADDTVFASKILAALEAALPELDDGEIFDVFRRLCLMIQLIEDINAKWEEGHYPVERPAALPSGLYQLVCSEMAFEEGDASYAKLFFARDILSEALAILRPN